MNIVETALAIVAAALAGIVLTWLIPLNEVKRTRASVLIALAAAGALVAVAAFAQSGRQTAPTQSAGEASASPPPAGSPSGTTSSAPTPTADASTPVTPPAPTETSDDSNYPDGTDPATDDAALQPEQSEPSPIFFLATVPKSAMVKEGRTGNCTGGCTGFRGGSARIAGTVYPQSWRMKLDGDGRRGTTSWNTVRACESVTATVGVDDEAPPGTVVTFTLAHNGGAAQTLATTALGEAVTFTEDLTGVATVEVAAYVSGPEVEDPRVVWGDIRATCTPGALGNDCRHLPRARSIATPQRERPRCPPATHRVFVPRNTACL